MRVSWSLLLSALACTGDKGDDHRGAAEPVEADTDTDADVDTDTDTDTDTDADTDTDSDTDTDTDTYVDASYVIVRPSEFDATVGSTDARVARPIGDATGDGHPDVLADIAAYLGDETWYSPGWCLFAGPLAPGERDPTSHTACFDVSAGFITISDLDEDGYGDWLLHRPQGMLWFGPLVGSYDDSGADAEWEFVGDADGDLLERGAQDIGDLDGDGYVDVSFGEWNDTTNGGMQDTYTDDWYGTGTVWITYGPFTGDSVGERQDRIVGEWIDHYVGYDMAPLGDLNGDGTDDLGLLTGYGTYVFLGPLASDYQEVSQADGWIAYGGSVVESTGHGELDPLGDINADGYADFVVNATSGQGAYVFVGPLSAGFTRADRHAELVSDRSLDPDRRSVAKAWWTGDIDADGHDDLLTGRDVTDDEYTGIAWLTFGPVTGSVYVDESPLAIRGDDDWLTIGRKATGVGDVSGDGTGDIQMVAYSTEELVYHTHFFFGESLLEALGP